MTYVLLEIGCVECHDPTDVIGIYEDETEARAAYEARATRLDGYVKPYVMESETIVVGTEYLQLHRWDGGESR